MARTMDSARGSRITSRTKLPSIFNMVSGSSRKYDSEESPVPKSSSAMPQPSARSLRIRSVARLTLATAVFSVSSKQKRSGGRPLERMRSSRNSLKLSSLSDWPEKLIAKASGPPANVSA